MVKEKNSAANSVKTGEVKRFDTTPVPRLTPELIPGAHKVFVAARKGMQAALARELNWDNHLTHNEAPGVFDIAVLGMLEHQRGV